jgi:DnaK suppressor protein
LQALLQARREALLSACTTAAGSTEPVELDQSRVGRLSRMDAMQLQAMSRENQRRRELELQRITAALGRIGDGEYGYCLHCGEIIAASRLEADPAAPLCIDCASRLESQTRR